MGVKYYRIYENQGVPASTLVCNVQEKGSLRPLAMLSHQTFKTRIKLAKKTFSKKHTATVFPELSLKSI